MKRKQLLILGLALTAFASSCKKPADLQAETNEPIAASDDLPSQVLTVVSPNVGLKTYYANYFKMGVAAGNTNITNPTQSALISKEFNNFTPDNAMKWRYIHPRYSEANADADYDFTKTDALVNYAIANNMEVRGHVLIWHIKDNLPLYTGKNYSWVTRDPDSVLLSRPEFFKRMKAHITKIMTRYKGKIKYYDVVNEAVSDNVTTQGPLGKNYTDMYKIAAKNGNPGESFIDSAFKFARQADPDAKLFYNDNRYEDPEKRLRIKTLIQNMQAAGTPIDGIGMQAHWWSDNPTPGKLENTIVAFKDMGLKIHITELDVSVHGQNENTMPADITFNATRESQQITNYRNHFNLFRKYKSVIESVTFWNVSDAYTWRTNYPVTGRTDYPLLFNTNNQRKQVYTSVVNDIP